MTNFFARGAFLLAASISVAGAAAAAPGEDFAPCADTAGKPDLSGSLCAAFPASADRAGPGAEKVSLFLRQFPATSPSRGQVWLLTGDSGAALYPMIGTLRLAFPGYDLVVPDRRAKSSAIRAAQDLQAEIDRYGGTGATLLYGTSKGSEVVLRAIPLVRERRIEAVILDSPAAIGRSAAPLDATGPETGGDQILGISPWLDRPAAPGQAEPMPRTLILQGDADPATLEELERNAPITAYKIKGAPGFLMLTVPECAAPLVRGFVEGRDGGAPCATKLTLRF